MTAEVLKSDANNLPILGGIADVSLETRMFRLEETTNFLRVAHATPLMYSVLALATANPANIKATAGRVFSGVLNNASAAAKYVRLYNKATAPTVGTDVPLMVFSIPASSSKEFNFGPTGMTFAAGIAISITGAAPDNDATVVAAGDVRATIAYQ